MAITPIDFPANPTDGQSHVENNETYVYQAAQDFWLGGQAGQVYLLNKANVGFLQKFYLGAFDTTNVPTTMPDGAPLLDYVMYFNTTTGTMMMWHGAPTNAWKSLVKPVPADTNVYTYVADGVRKSFTGADVNGLTPVLDSTNPEKIVIWNGAYLTESTVTNPADFTVNYVTSTFNLTRVPRAGTTVNIHVLAADDSNTTKDPVVFHIGSTTAAKAFAGTLPSDRLKAAIAPVLPQLGTVIIVSHDPAVGADNGYEGVWYYDGTFSNIMQGGSGSGGGSRVFQTTATVLEARKGTLTTTVDILNSNFTSIFSTVAQDGDWVVVPLVQGNLAKYSGLYVRDPASHNFIPAATSYSTNFIEGFVRAASNRLSDIDIATKGIPTGSFQVITDTNKRELLVASPTGSWISMYSEAQVHKWAAEASLWQSAIAKAQLNTLPAPAITNKGQYWTWIGEPDPADPLLSVGGQVVDAGYPRIGVDLAGDKLQIGDWIQSDGTKWIHVPADLLNKSRWLSLGSFKEYTAGASNEKGTLVRIKLKWDPVSNTYISSPAGKYKYFQAATDLSATDPAPPAAGWDDITPIVSPNKLENVVYKATLEDKDILIFNDTIKQFELKPLPSSGINDWDPSKTYTDVGTPVLRTQSGAGDVNWTSASYPEVYRSKSNTTPNVNMDPLDPVRGPLFWEKLVRVKVADLEDVVINNIADNQGIFWNAAQNYYENKFINALFNWVDRSYAPQEVVYNKGHWYTPNKPINLGDAEPSTTNADWDLVKGLSSIGDLDNVTINTPTVNQILTYNSTLAEWQNKDVGNLFLWSDKDWAQDTLVYDRNTNYLWVSLDNVVTGDAGPDMTKLGDYGYKWIPVSADYVPSIWTGAIDEVSNTFVIRRPNGGTDTYTGPTRLFLCLNSGATDPIADAANYLEIGHKPMSTDDLTDVDTSTAVPTDNQILQYDATVNKFIPADLPPPPNTWEQYNATKAYPQFSYVSDRGFAYIAITNIAAGTAPTPALTTSAITTKLVSTPLTLALIEAFTDTNSSSALTVGDYYTYDLGTTTVPYTVLAGTFAGLQLIEAKGFIMLTDKVPNSPLGFKGWTVIRDSLGTAPATATNAPPATVNVPNSPWIRLGVETLNDLRDVDTETRLPVAGQFLGYDSVNSIWKPQAVLMGLNGLTDVNLLTAPPTDGQALTYDLASTSWIPANPVTTLSALTDVDVTTRAPVVGDILHFNTGGWENIAPTFYTKAEVDTKVSTLVTGISHGEPVHGVLTIPPIIPITDEFIIVGIGGSANFMPAASTISDNDVIYWDGAAWVPKTPNDGDAHLNEADNSIYHFSTANGWVKIATAAAPTTLDALTDVDLTTPATANQILSYDAASNTFKAANLPSSPVDTTGVTDGALFAWNGTSSTLKPMKGFERDYTVTIGGAATNGWVDLLHMGHVDAVLEMSIIDTERSGINLELRCNTVEMGNCAIFEITSNSIATANKFNRIRVGWSVSLAKYVVQIRTKAADANADVLSVHVGCKTRHVDVTAAPTSTSTADLIEHSGFDIIDVYPVANSAGAGVVTGAEPAAADRHAGMLWDDGVRLWIWLVSPGVWRQV